MVWLLWFAYFWATYVITTWLPTLFVNDGYTQAQAITATKYLTFGAMLGAIVLGLLSLRLVLSSMIAVLLYVAAGLVAAWVLFDFDLMTQQLILCALGFATASNYGLYAIVGGIYPPEIRATGLGSALGVGRAGGMLSPIFVGFVVAAGWNLQEMMLTLVVSAFALAATLVLLVTQRQRRLAP
jgi:hypothetical protein